MRQITLTLPDDVYLWVELCAAKDDLRIGEGLSQFLTAIARNSKERHDSTVHGPTCRLCGGPHKAKGLCCRCYDLSLKGMSDVEIEDRITSNAGVFRRGERGARVGYCN